MRFLEKYLKEQEKESINKVKYWQEYEAKNNEFKKDFNKGTYLKELIKDLDNIKYDENKKLSPLAELLDKSLDQIMYKLDKDNYKKSNIYDIFNDD